MFLLYHAYVYLEFLILACTIYILAPDYKYYLAEQCVYGEAQNASGNEDQKEIDMQYFVCGIRREG